MQHTYKSVVLTLIDPNVYYYPVKVVKGHTPYIEIGDDTDLVAVCYSDSDAEREDDGEASIDTQPEPSIDNRAFPDYRESFAIKAASPPRRKIRVVKPDEYGVYRHEDDNAHTLDGWIIKEANI